MLPFLKEGFPQAEDRRSGEAAKRRSKFRTERAAASRIGSHTTAYHLFRFSRNNVALYDFLSPNTFQKRVMKIRTG